MTRFAPFRPLAALHPVQTGEDTKLLLVHALGHVRDLISRSIRVIANGPLAPFVQCYAGRRAERPAQPRVASSGPTDRSADVIRHRHRQQGRPVLPDSRRTTPVDRAHWRHPPPAATHRDFAPLTERPET